MTTLNRMLVRKGALALAVSALMLAGCNSGSSSGSGSDSGDEPQGPVRATAQGPVVGLTTPYGVAFLGIPYAKPPVGELRLADPQPADSWGDEPRQATAFGGSCIQPMSTFGAATSTEDCLYLNVYAPENADNLPVMVWIHGGAFETGSGSESYIPTGLLEHDVVVVTINYRMGVLGFLSHPDLGAEGASGSYGILDQQLALQWVQDNIGQFGGDAANVTLFGESAGAASVLAHIASPVAGDLFDKAIIQSGAYIGVISQPSQTMMEQVGASFFGGLGCETIECIRALDAQDILAAQQTSGLSYVPSLRADILPKDVKTSLADGDYNKVPVLAGSNLDEGRLFVGIAELTRMGALIQAGESPAGAVLTPADYRDEVVALVGEDLADFVITHYPLANYNNTSEAVSALNTDVSFACPSLPQLAQLAATSGFPVYGYEFTDRDAPSIIPPGNSFDLGAAHAFEIQYVFGNRESRAARGMNEASLDLADAMTAYWASFAHDGDPNLPDGTGVFWESVQTDGNLLELDPEQIAALSVDDFATRHLCQIWNASAE